MGISGHKLRAAANFIKIQIGSQTAFWMCHISGFVKYVVLIIGKLENLYESPHMFVDVANVSAQVGKRLILTLRSNELF